MAEFCGVVLLRGVLNTNAYLLKGRNRMRKKRLLLLSLYVFVFSSLLFLLRLFSLFFSLPYALTYFFPLSSPYFSSLLLFCSLLLLFLGSISITVSHLFFLALLSHFSSLPYCFSSLLPRFFSSLPCCFSSLTVIDSTKG